MHKVYLMYIGYSVCKMYDFMYIGVIRPISHYYTIYTKWSTFYPYCAKYTICTKYIKYAYVVPAGLHYLLLAQTSSPSPYCKYKLQQKGYCRLASKNAECRRKIQRLQKLSYKRDEHVPKSCAGGCNTEVIRCNRLIEIYLLLMQPAALVHLPACCAPVSSLVQRRHNNYRMYLALMS